MANEPVCVRRAVSLEEAEIVVAWLGEQGIEATIGDPGSTGVMAFGVTDEGGIEVYVGDATHAEQAIKLLDEHDDEIQARHTASKGPTEVVCEECKEKSTFAAEYRGSVQNCEHCGAHVDVPE